MLQSWQTQTHRQWVWLWHTSDVRCGCECASKMPCTFASTRPETSCMHENCVYLLASQPVRRGPTLRDDASQTAAASRIIYRIDKLRFEPEFVVRSVMLELVLATPTHKPLTNQKTEYIFAQWELNYKFDDCGDAAQIAARDTFGKAKKGPENPLSSGEYANANCTLHTHTMHTARHTRIQHAHTPCPAVLLSRA